MHRMCRSLAIFTDDVRRHKNKFPEDFAIKKISNFTENLWVILNNVHKLFRDVQS